jgi:hypothetical protein
MDACVRTKFPTMEASRAALSPRVGGVGPPPVATARSLPSQQWLPRLTDYHRRCLGKRLADCHQDLAQAMRALSQAQAWQPGDQSLEEMFELVRAAHGFTGLAQRIGGAATEANLGVGTEDPGASRSHRMRESKGIGERRRQRRLSQQGSNVPVGSGFFPPRDRTELSTPANADAPSVV